MPICLHFFCLSFISKLTEKIFNQNGIQLNSMKTTITPNAQLSMVQDRLCKLSHLARSFSANSIGMFDLKTTATERTLRRQQSCDPLRITSNKFGSLYYNGRLLLGTMSSLITANNIRWKKMLNKNLFLLKTRFQKKTNKPNINKLFFSIKNLFFIFTTSVYSVCFFNKKNWILNQLNFIKHHKDMLSSITAQTMKLNL